MPKLSSSWSWEQNPRLGAEILKTKYYIIFGQRGRFFFLKAPGLAQAIELAISRQLLLDASPKADGSDEIEYRCRVQQHSRAIICHCDKIKYSMIISMNLVSIHLCTVIRK